VCRGEAHKLSLAAFPPLDVIVMLDVIEHLEDPVTVLEAGVEKLRPGGVIYLTTLRPGISHRPLLVRWESSGG
jgi:2-polyprenyl-3-methyl-5-hydroxy-6-metoxy-1,4-benzoquinol methylase